MRKAECLSEVCGNPEQQEHATGNAGQVAPRTSHHSPVRLGWCQREDTGQIQGKSRANTGPLSNHSGQAPQAARVGRKQGKERAGPDRSVACGAHGMPKLRWQAQGKETASQLAGPRWGDSETPRSPLSPGGTDGAPTHLPVRFSVAVAEANRERKRQKPESVLSTCSCRRRICVFVYL